jgi:hypothetical protein
MSRLADDRFRIFVSHKHEDHQLALTVHQALEAVCSKIECFVSGVDISAGADWNREIRDQLIQSHMLVLLFTRPTAVWDWCLFETGLFTRSEVDDVTAVICLHDPAESPPSPLANIQSVPVRQDHLERFLGDLCRSTWRLSDDWRTGALAPTVSQARLEKAASAIVDAFPSGDRAAGAVHHPCHRLMLDLRGVEGWKDGIPNAARVIEGPGLTTEYTLSLFNMLGGQGRLTWGDLLDAVDGQDAAWRTQLDRRFTIALQGDLFTPITATFRAWNQGRRRQRVMKPILYRIVREPSAPRSDGRAPVRGRPVEVTVLFDPQVAPARVGGHELHLVRINARFQVEVIEEFAGTVRARAREGLPVLEDLGEAVDLVYDEANTYGVFDEAELRRTYGSDYTDRGIDAMGQRWQASLAELRSAMAAADFGAVEAQLAELRELNRTFSTLAAERYLDALHAGT